MSFDLANRQIGGIGDRWVRSTQSGAAPAEQRAFGTAVIIILLAGTMIIEALVSPSQLQALVQDLGLRSSVWSWTDPSSYIRMLTYSLLHANGGHFFWNAVVLLLVGCVVEKRIGLPAISLIFLGGIVVSGFSHLLIFPAEPRPLIGVSGAVSTLFGVAFLLVGGIGFDIRIPLSLRWIHLSIRRVMWLWLGIQIIGVMTMIAAPATPYSVAYWSHLAGFAAGIGGGLIYRRYVGRPYDAESEPSLAASYGSAGD